MDVREQWPGRFTYILAAIGFAAGLGNLWRFPMLAYEHGGAAFGKWFSLVFRLIPVILGTVFLVAIYGEFQGPYGGYPSWALLLIGGLPLTLILVLALVLGRVITQREQDRLNHIKTAGCLPSDPD